MMFAYLTLLLACGEEPSEQTLEEESIDSAEPEPEPDCTNVPLVTWESWGEGFFITWCQPCHSVLTVERNGAPEGIDFDTETDLVRWQESVQRTVLDEESMPVGGGLSEDDAVLLKALLDCGLPM